MPPFAVRGSKKSSRYVLAQCLLASLITHSQPSRRIDGSDIYSGRWYECWAHSAGEMLAFEHCSSVVQQLGSQVSSQSRCNAKYLMPTAKYKQACCWLYACQLTLENELLPFFCLGTPCLHLHCLCKSVQVTTTVAAHFPDIMVLACMVRLLKWKAPLLNVVPS